MKQVFEKSRTRLSPYSNCFILVWLRTRRSAHVLAPKGGHRSAGCLGCLNNPMRGFVQAKLLVSAHQERVALASSAIDRRPIVDRWVILAERSSWLCVSACSGPILGSEHRPPLRSRSRACKAQTLLRKVAKFQFKKTRMAERSRAVYKPACTTCRVVNSLTNRNQNKPSVCLAVYNPTGCTGRFIQASNCSGRSATNRRFVRPGRARPRCSLHEQHFGCSASLPRYANKTSGFVRPGPVGAWSNPRCSGPLGPEQHFGCSASLSNPRYSNRVGFRIILENTGVKWDHRVLRPFWPPFTPRRSQPITNRPPTRNKPWVCSRFVRTAPFTNRRFVQALQTEGLFAQRSYATGQFCFAKVRATVTWFRSTANKPSVCYGAISLRENALNRQQTFGLFVPRRLQIVSLDRPVPANFATQSREPAGSELGWFEGPATQLRPFWGGNSNSKAIACSYSRNKSVAFVREYPRRGQASLREEASLSTGVAFIRASAPEQTSGLLNPTIKTKSGVNKTRLKREFKQPFTVWGFVMDTKYCRTEVLGCRRPIGARVDPKRVQLISPFLASSFGGNQNEIPVNSEQTFGLLQRDFATRKYGQPACTNLRFVRTAPFTNHRFVQAGSDLLLQAPTSPLWGQPELRSGQFCYAKVRPGLLISEAEQPLTKPSVLFGSEAEHAQGLWNFVTKTRYKTIRPLLNLSRENLTTLCKDLGLPVYPDKSNKAVQYSRNRLREQILPAVKLFLNPKIDDALFKLAELLTQDFSVVSHLVNTSSALLQPFRMEVEHSRRRLK